MRFLCLSFALTTVGFAADGGQISGHVTDESSGAVSATIRLVPRGAMSPWIKGAANRSGAFRIDDVPPGTYSVEAWANAFRANGVRVVVTAGDIVDVGTIQLGLMGCDAPGVICDSFFGPLSARPDPHPILSREAVTLPLDASVDLDRGKVFDGVAGRTDLSFSRRDGALYLIPANGAQISAPNSASPICDDAHYVTAPVRIDGLGPGHDMCVRTKEGRPSHIMITNDVPSDAVELKLWYVTRKR